jgi:PIN domain nuclease of toxin-antitoxin system
MRLLLETHIFLWYIGGDNQLLDATWDAISDPENDVYLSVISVWEALIKCKLGKLPLPQSPEKYLRDQRERHLISSLPLDEGSVAKLVTLPLIHRDPFDRMLVCQAMQHDLTIVTVDDAICAYTNNVLR